MRAYKFSPNLASPEERSETFVAREAILEDLLDRVHTESGSRHCILMGPRGIGKTHLLLLLADRIEANEELVSDWMVIRFAEEEYSITTLAELFLRVIESLPDGKSKAEEIGRDADLALAHILDFCANSGKKILLLLDNIHLYFNQFTDTDIGRMRDILMSKSVFLIIGAAPSYFKQMKGYQEPFYSFFEPIHINELSSEEVEDMLRCRAEFENEQDFLLGFDECRDRIQAIAHLTGGNPRLILMLYQVICKAGVMEAAEAFKRLLDDLTPYFQGRMDGLPTQGRKVLDTLASLESPSTPTELASATGMHVNAVNTQLKRLKDNGFVQQLELPQRKKSTRYTKYELTERLFRMWREMRTEAGRKQLNFLMRFLKLWYTPMQLLNETERLATRLREAQRHEKPDIFSHMEYLRKATPELIQPELEKIHSHIRDGRFEMSDTQFPVLKELTGYEESILENPNKPDVWKQRGILLEQLGKHKEALDSFGKAIELEPKDAPAWYYRGLALGNLERYHEAFESCDKAVELDPEDAIAWYYRGLALGNLERYHEAFESFVKAVELDPEDAIAWCYRGLALGDLKRYQEALESCDKAVELDPEDAIAWYYRGLALGDLKRYQEALESYDKAIELDPEDAAAWYYRGLALEDLKRYQEALESYDKAIELDPEDAYAWRNRGMVLGNLKRYQEALENFDKAIELNSGDAIAWRYRGLALDNLERYHEALESYDKAVELDPEDAYAWRNRGRILGNLKRYYEALESYDKAVELNSENVAAWLYRGKALNELERYHEALESLDKAIELDSENANAWLYRGEALNGLRRYQEALKSCDKVAELQPDDAILWGNRGCLLGQLGKYEEALESCDRAIELQPDLPFAWDNRSLALFNLERHEEAMESLKKAVEFADIKGLKNVSEFTALLKMETELLNSLNSLKRDNLGTTRNSLRSAIEFGKHADEEDIQILLFGFVRSILKTGKAVFIQEAIEIIAAELSEDYRELFRPFSIAAEYMRTKDVSILERLQQEMRELVQDIVEEMKKDEVVK